ncbi:MAG: tetratricopeptide repeat protein [Lentisphaeria bacterium]|nr:tetratricopeptide repeat protein [Lentisphaeria bacterium]
MEQNTSDTPVQEAPGQTGVAPSDAAPCPCGCGRGKPNYNRTVVAIWAVLLMVLVLVGYLENQRRIRNLSEVESLVAQASQLYDRQLFEESTELLRHAAERGYAPAQTYYGGSLKMGIGTPQNLPGAVEWYRKAAAQDYPVAYFELAVCYQHGFGVERDLDQAEAWYRRAYDAGIVEESQKALDELAITRARESGLRTP